MAKRPQRPSISKLRRFEIFKRDGFACQYCGRHPPAVVLEIDHVVALSRGGAADDDNLITACFDCNRGKAARLLHVAPRSLADKAAEVAEREEQLRGYQEIFEQKRQRLEAEVWRVIEVLTGETHTSHAKFRSVKMFVERLGVHDALDAAEATLAHGCNGDNFRYFCGVCWTKIKRIQGDG